MIKNLFIVFLGIWWVCTPLHALKTASTTTSDEREAWRENFIKTPVSNTETIVVGWGSKRPGTVTIYNMCCKLARGECVGKTIIKEGRARLSESLNRLTQLQNQEKDMKTAGHAKAELLAVQESIKSLKDDIQTLKSRYPSSRSIALEYGDEIVVSPGEMLVAHKHITSGGNPVPVIFVAPETAKKILLRTRHVSQEKHWYTFNRRGDLGLMYQLINAKGEIMKDSMDGVTKTTQDQGVCFRGIGRNIPLVWSGDNPGWIRVLKGCCITSESNPHCYGSEGMIGGKRDMKSGDRFYVSPGEIIVAGGGLSSAVSLSKYTKPMTNIPTTYCRVPFDDEHNSVKFLNMIRVAGDSLQGPVTEIRIRPRESKHGNKVLDHIKYFGDMLKQTTTMKCDVIRLKNTVTQSGEPETDEEDPDDMNDAMSDS